MSTVKSLTFIEIDVPPFVATSPETEETRRFAMPTNYLPRSAEFDAIASIVGVSFTPAVISLGENLGQRATLTISFKDHRHIMAGEPFESGTFWGKWRARYGTRLRGRAVRWINGTLGQSLEEMETRHFIVDSTEGPSPQGVYTIIAKDALKLLDGDRAQAPYLSEGSLVGNINNAVTTATLTPTGIGNFGYPSSGYVAIGGEEIVSFTRVGDVLTIVRGQFNTAPAAHEAGDRVQLCLYYLGDDPADILYDLFVNYAAIPPEWIDLVSWQNETSAYLQRVYTALIAEPTSVKQLASELVEQAGLAMWWDPLTEQIRLQVLRSILTDANVYGEDNTLEGSLMVQEQPNTRVSQCWTYFGQRNPLEPIDEEKNFRSTLLTIAPTEEFAYGGEAIKKIFSRWIPFGGKSVAERLNNIIIGRFKDPPRRFTWAAQRYNGVDPILGQGYQVKSWSLQNQDGTPTQAPVQVTRLNPRPDRFEIEAEEMLFENLDPTDLVDRVIIIDANSYNLNFRTLHDSIYPAPTGSESPPITVTCIIDSGVKVGSALVNTPAFDVGTWPAGFDQTNLFLEVRGRVQGLGGDGGSGADAPSGGQGKAGGTALYTRENLTVITTDGEIWGGGGGGGRSGNRNDFGMNGGGGGAGFNGGALGPRNRSGHDGQPGTTEAGGIGGQNNYVPGFGGTGGGPGLPGATGGAATDQISSGPKAGGAAGRAIDGVSFITLSGPEGDHRGPEVN